MLSLHWLIKNSRDKSAVTTVNPCCSTQPLSIARAAGGRLITPAGKLQINKSTDLVVAEFFFLGNVYVLVIACKFIFFDHFEKFLIWVFCTTISWTISCHEWLIT
jgi:hypothetical protein